MSDVAWPAEWLRGVLEPCVLHVLADGPTYGYAIAERLDELGLGRLKGGTLYPLLGRLEAAGHVTVEWRIGDGGPGRKYYELTADGRAALADARVRWRAFTTTTLAILAHDAAAPGGTTTPDGSAHADAASGPPTVPGDALPAGPAAPAGAAASDVAARNGLPAPAGSSTPGSHPMPRSTTEVLP